MMRKQKQYLKANRIEGAENDCLDYFRDLELISGDPVHCNTIPQLAEAWICHCPAFRGKAIPKAERLLRSARNDIHWPPVAER